MLQYADTVLIDGIEVQGFRDEQDSTPEIPGVSLDGNTIGAEGRRFVFSGLRSAMGHVQRGSIVAMGDRHFEVVQLRPIDALVMWLELIQK